MGEHHHEPFQLSFNRSLRVDFRGSRVTSDGGLMMLRELDERLGMGALIERYLTDTRHGHNMQFPLADLLRHRSTAGWRVMRM
jgi:Transposase DDE domain group 1